MLLVCPLVMGGVRWTLDGGLGKCHRLVCIIVVTQSSLSERFCLVDIYLFFQSFASLIVSLHLQAKCWAAGWQLGHPGGAASAG